MDAAIAALKEGFARLTTTDVSAVARQVLSSATASQFEESFVQAFSSIAVSEFGDKTFFIAALMAMKHPRTAVFLGCWGALAGMTVLSSVFGLLTHLLPKSLTHYASIALFLFFGGKMLYEGLTHDPNEENEELKEAEREILGDEGEDGKDARTRKGPRPSTRGRGRKAPPASPPPKRLTTKSSQAKDKPKDAPSALSTFLAVVLKGLTVTFLAEWGDRSQLVTMGMAASENVPGVVLGGVLGHACLTSVAVLGGRKFADKVPENIVQVLGGLLFLAFGIHSVMEGQ